MDQTSHSSPAILVIIGVSAFSRHRLSDPVFVVRATRHAPDLDTVVSRMKMAEQIVRPKQLTLPYRRTLALTNGSNA